MLNEHDALAAVVVKHAREAFVDEATIGAQWRDLGFKAPPDLARAIDEHDGFIQLLRESGAEVHLLPQESGTTLDSIYVRDGSISSPSGMILCAMGKPGRTGEPAAAERAFRELRIPVAGRIEPPGRLEGGDVVWLDPRTAVVGQGYRTNAEGIRQLRSLLPEAVTLVEVPLPHWRGAGDVMHLMSLISPIAHDLAVVFSPLLPVPFREWLRERGVRLVEVPDEEFETMGTNVLALAPGRCVVLAGNPRTRAALERAAVSVVEYSGTEISVKGAGGPTCLTRPILRTLTRNQRATGV